MTGTIIYNGTRSLEPQPKHWRTLLPNQQENQYDYTFLTIGRVAEQKNHKLLLDVFREFHDEGILVQLLIMGEYLDLKLHKDLLKAKPNNVHFLGHVDDATSFMNSVDAFCLSSKWEGMPITVIEALASGTIVISTDVGGISEMIDDSCGILVRSKEPKAFKKSIMTFMNMTQKAKQMLSTNAKSRYLKQFTMEHCGKQYESLYEKKIDARAKAQH